MRSVSLSVSVSRSASVPIPSISSTMLAIFLNRLVNDSNFFRKFGFSSSDIYLASIHDSNLHVSNQALGNCILKVSDKTKAPTSTSIRISNNLNILNFSILTKVLLEFFLAQLIIKTSNKDLIFNSLRLQPL